jgi:AraC-like DNA-binding protein
LPAVICQTIISFLLLFVTVQIVFKRFICYSTLAARCKPVNRAIKVSTDKTTSQIIAERIFRESKILLKHSAWNVSEIACASGFTETTHFNNFFKKYVQLSPLKFRNI